MEDILIAELEATTNPVKEPVHQPNPKGKKKDPEGPKQPEKFIRAKSPDELRKMTLEQRERYFNWMRDRDREKVKGVFRFYERPGGDMEFVYRAYKGDPVEKYSMIDGQTYEIPLGVARHLNKNGWYPEYEYVPGGKTILVPGGQPTNMRIGKKTHRFGFQKLDFLDDNDAEFSDVQSGIASVEFVGNQNLVR